MLDDVMRGDLATCAADTGSDTRSAGGTAFPVSECTPEAGRSLVVGTYACGRDW